MTGRPPLTPSEWHHLRELFQSAQDLDAAARSDFLAAACVGDPFLRTRVEELLAHDGSGGTVLDEPAAKDLAGLLSSDEPEADYTGYRLDGRYLLEAKLDRSGFSTVYRARDERVGRPVVIKVLRRSGVSHDFLKKELRREIEALARIDHEGVVGLLDYGDGPDGRPFLVLRLVEGVTLGKVMETGPMRPERVAVLLRGLGQALEAAHQRGVWHRDLKPQNIMLRDAGRPDERPVIIDFGIAAVRDPDNPQSTSIQLAGSPDYMAPEQPTNSSPASDIYALGLIGFEMLVGQHVKSMAPKFGSVPDEIVRDGLAELHPEVPAAARELLAAAVAYDPRARPPHARRFGEQAATALSPATAFPHRRAILPYVIAAAALTASGLAWWMWNPNAAPVFEIEYEVTAAPGVGAAAGPFLPGGGRQFHAGDGIRLAAHSRQSGYLYLFNENQPADGSGAHFNLLLPRGFTWISASGTVQVPESAEDWIRFDARPGVERLWLIWTRERIPDLDTVAGATDDRGAIGDGRPSDNLQAFLARHGNHPPKVAIDNRARRVVVRATVLPLVHFVDFRHQ